MDINVIIKSIEAQWRSRAKTQDLKPGTAKYANLEVEFFTGAMAALQAAFPNENASDEMTRMVPPKWIVSAISGRPICPKE